ncbi:D-2-hydroxyacid dehydrogenase [Sphingomonas sp.]|uniref:D-2-hydroxyacid dehydrogenase n=1 Tax=Sphingomonas sp. TaxID=28214 RepID=UPI002ED9D461
MTEVLVYLREPERSVLRFDALADISGVAVRGAASIEEARPFLAAAEVLITLGPHLAGESAEILDAMPRLRWVQLITTGTDNVAEHLAGRDVTLTNAHGLHGRQMSEAALGAMLALARGLPRHLRNQEARVWDRFPAALLSGKTVGIVGLGAIAEALAPRCRALGMRVVGITATPRPLESFDEVRARGDMASALSGVDHLVLLAPYSASTHRLIEARALAAMKPGGFVINLARGGVLDEAALVEALDNGQLAGAALDVFEHEPLPPGDPLWSHPRVIVTPHVGGLHDGYAQDMLALAESNLRRFLAGGADALLNRVELSKALQHAQ